MAEIGELFVSLGVKGSEKTIGALTSVGSGMKGLASMSLEAKAAILGVFYALEQLMSASAQWGTNVLNFSAITGESGKTFQQWAVAAKLAGATANDVSSSFTNLQNNMLKFRLHEFNPRGLQQFAQIVGGFDQTKTENLDYVMSKLRTFAQAKGVDPAFRNMILKEFGLSDSIIGPLVRGKLNDAQLAKATQFIFSDKQNQNLDKTREGMARLAVSWEKAFGDLTAQHGQQLIQNINELSTSLLQLVKALDALGTHSGIFTAIGSASHYTSGIIKGATEDVTDPNKVVKKILTGLYNAAVAGHLNDWSSPPRIERRGSSVNQTVNQTINAHGSSAKDASEIGRQAKSGVHSAHKEIKKTYQNNSAQQQRN